MKPTQLTATIQLTLISKRTVPEEEHDLANVLEHSTMLEALGEGMHPTVVKAPKLISILPGGASKEQEEQVKPLIMIGDVLHGDATAQVKLERIEAILRDWVTA